ncbi:hypothetical protein [Streptomyces aureocirculatus]|uniref:hypothetical protein n=1 Tax=Streptomyces aureocirculatus TaxID=67275 RepID=UPI0004C55211|nr:hypothetical protein [Streptomyces aureocirculatus]
MNQTTELQTAIGRLRATPAPAMSPTLRQALDELLVHARTTAIDLHRLTARPGDTIRVHPHALAIAQAINNK